MIVAVVERRFQTGKTDDAVRLMVELRRRMMKRGGCISDETLRSEDDPSLWLDVSTLTYSDRWKEWEAAREHKELQSEIENLLTAPENISIFDIVK